MLRRSGPRFRPHRARVFVTANHYINFPQLRVMDEQGQVLGVMSKQEALDQAFAQDKDLVLITDKAQPPVAKIIELSKYKYLLSQKKADERKHARAQDIKEIRLRPFIDDNDLRAKIRKTEDFLKRNQKVRLSMELKGRAITKQDLGREILAQVVAALAEISVVENEAKLIGKRIQLQLMPKKKQSKK